MASTQIIRYINDASSGGDGTTNATSGPNAAYATPSAAVAAEYTSYPNLVTSDIDLYFYTTGSFTNFSDPGFTTDSTHRLLFEDYGSGTDYSTSGTFTTLADFSGVYADFNKSSFNFTGTSHSRALLQSDGNADQCKFHSSATSQNSSPVVVEELIRSYIILDDTGGYSWTTDIDMTQCTIIAPNVDITVSAFYTGTYINCYYHLNSFTTATSRTTTITNCAFSMASITSDGDDVLTDLLYSVPYTTATFVNVTQGSEDLDLASGSGLIDEGFDNSGSYTTDIEDNTFSTWDIGAYAYESGGTTYQESVSESFSVSDSGVGNITVQGSLSDSITISDPSASILTVLGVAAETITFIDSSSGDVIYRGSISESLTISDVLSSFIVARSTISATIDISDIALDAGQLAQGIITVTFTAKRPGVSFTSKAPSVEFSNG